jgi:hypothetical protein
MKNIIKITFMAFAVTFLMSNCVPKEFDDYKLGSGYNISEDQIKFDMDRLDDEWTYRYTVTFTADPVKTPFSYEVRFGHDDAIAKNDSGSHVYVVAKGTYTAECVVFNPNGDIIIKSKEIKIDNDHDRLTLDDPASIQFMLTGGRDNVNGKVWVLGPWTAMRNPDNRNTVWWPFDNDENKGIMNYAMQNDEFIFKPNSIRPNGAFTYNNNGDTFCNESLENTFPDGKGESYVTTYYEPPTDATWSVSERDGKKYLTINKGFLGYPTDPADLNMTEYEIYSFSATSIKCILSSGWNAWSFELSCAPPIALTGAVSKTWVIDGYNKHTAEAATLSGLTINGFMGLGESYSQGWWAAGPGDKSEDECGWTMYDWKMIFGADNSLKIETKGEGYGRKKYDGGNFTSTSVDGDDMVFNYAGGDYTYTYDKAKPWPKLTLSGNAFLTYYCGTQEYEIVALSETVMAVVVHSTQEGHDWILVFTPDGEQQ